MANIVNQYGQVKVGVRTQLTPPAPSSLWTSLYSVYNADSIGSSSLKTSLFAAYNGESNANDSFGSNNGTAMGGLTYTTGKIGNAFTGNNVNGYVALPTNSLNFSDTSFSVSVWVNFASNTHNEIVNSYYWAGSGNEYGWYLRHYLGNIEAAFVNGVNTRKITYSYAGLYNAWNMITMTKELNGNMLLYINNTLVGTYTTTENPSITTSHYCSIGLLKFLGGEVGVLKSGSKIDGLSIWNKTITQAEITELYNSGNGAQYITDNFYKPTTNDALNTYNGTAQGGLTYGVGKVGTAFVGNGTNAYVSLPNNSLNFTSDFSYSVWINLSNTTNLNPIINNYLENGLDYRGNLLFVYNNLLYFRIDNSTTTYYDLTTPFTITNSWVHIVITRKFSTRTRIYLNGLLVNSNNSAVNPTYFGNMLYNTIGAYYDGNGWRYLTNNSKIDAVSVWNRELTASDVTELYNSGNGKQYPN